jgi:hypothetical protein
MNSKFKTGFGLYDTARQIARRRQKEIQRAEASAQPSAVSVETLLARDLFPYAKQFKRPLAA